MSCTTRNLCPFVVCLMSAIGNAQFTDTFSDGNATDGEPVAWTGSPFSFVETDDGHAASVSLPGGGFEDVDAYVEGSDFGDVTLRTRLRAEGEGKYSIGLHARNVRDENGRADATFYSLMDEKGMILLAGLGLGGVVEQWVSPIVDAGFLAHETAAEMRLDVVGSTASLAVWPAGSEEVPPQIVVDLPDWIPPVGDVGFWAANTEFPPTDLNIEFDYFQVEVPKGNDKCDFNDNLECNLADIDLLPKAIGSSASTFDLNKDGTVESSDIEEWLASSGNRNLGRPYLPGDATLDGDVDSADLNAVGLNWQSTTATSWSQGDFNGDKKVDSNDLNTIGLNRQQAKGVCWENLPLPLQLLAEL